MAPRPGRWREEWELVGEDRRGGLQAELWQDQLLTLGKCHGSLTAGGGGIRHFPCKQISEMELCIVSIYLYPTSFRKI